MFVIVYAWHKCRDRHLKNLEAVNGVSNIPLDYKNNDPVIDTSKQLDKSRATLTQSRCISDVIMDIFEFWKQIVAQVQHDFHYYVPQGSRVCA